MCVCVTVFLLFQPNMSQLPMHRPLVRQLRREQVTLVPLMVLCQFPQVRTWDT